VIYSNFITFLASTGLEARGQKSEAEAKPHESEAHEAEAGHFGLVILAGHFGLNLVILAEARPRGLTSLFKINIIIKLLFTIAMLMQSI